jgi:hypothetical protein
LGVLVALVEKKAEAFITVHNSAESTEHTSAQNSAAVLDNGSASYLTAAWRELLPSLRSL